MTPSAPLDRITTALLTLLRTTGRTVYDAVYAGDPTKPAYPYAVLYVLDGGDSDATPDMGFTRSDVIVPYQITTVSSLRNQAQAVGRQLRDTFLTGELVIPDGWLCTLRDLDPVMPGIDRVGENPTATFNHHQRVFLTVSPA